MYSSDLVEAFAHEQQQTILARAAAGRRVRTLADGATPRRHRSRPHPVAAFHSWLAAGQL